MANVFSDFATLQASAVADMSTAPNLKSYGGNLHFVQVRKTGYTAATADPLFLIRLPKGARLIPQLCSVDYGDPGDACVLSIGTFTTAATPVVIDVDAYGTALDLGSAAGRKSFSEAGTKGVDFLAPASFTQDTWIVATFTTVTTGVSHTETWNLAYTLA
jgi:hypothetical protein